MNASSPVSVALKICQCQWPWTGLENCCPQVGPQVFPRVFKAKDFSLLDEVADADEDVATPENVAVGMEMRHLLQFAEPWTTEPDVQRVRKELSMQSVLLLLVYY